MKKKNDHAEPTKDEKKNLGERLTRIKYEHIAFGAKLESHISTMLISTMLTAIPHLLQVRMYSSHMDINHTRTQGLQRSLFILKIFICVPEK